MRVTASGKPRIYEQALSYAEAVVESCSIKKVSLKISQNSQESTCARSLFS